MLKTTNDVHPTAETFENNGVLSYLINVEEDREGVRFLPPSHCKIRTISFYD